MHTQWKMTMSKWPLPVEREVFHLWLFVNAVISHSLFCFLYSEQNLLMCRICVSISWYFLVITNHFQPQQGSLHPHKEGKTSDLCIRLRSPFSSRGRGEECHQNPWRTLLRHLSFSSQGCSLRLLLCGLLLWSVYPHSPHRLGWTWVPSLSCEGCVSRNAHSLPQVKKRCPQVYP